MYIFYIEQYILHFLMRLTSFNLIYCRIVGIILNYVWYASREIDCVVYKVVQYIDRYVIFWYNVHICTVECMVQDKCMEGIIYVKKLNSIDSNVIIWFILTPYLNPTSQSLLPLPLKPHVYTSPNKPAHIPTLTN